MQFSVTMGRNFRVKVKSLCGFAEDKDYPVLAIQEYCNEDEHCNECNEDECSETYFLLPDDQGDMQWVFCGHCLFAGLD